MSYESIISKINGLTDRGRNTALEMRILLTEMLDELSGSTGGSSGGTQNNFSRVINVSGDDLINFSGYSETATTEENLATYINSLNYNKQPTDSDIWIDYSFTTPIPFTFHLSQLEKNSDNGNDYSDSYPWEIIHNGVTYTLNDNAGYTNDAAGELAAMTDWVTIFNTIPNIEVSLVTPSGYNWSFGDKLFFKFVIDLSKFPDNKFEFTFTNQSLRNDGRIYTNSIKSEDNDTATCVAIFEDANGVQGYGSDPWYDKDLNDIVVTTTGNFSNSIFIE